MALTTFRRDGTRVDPVASCTEMGACWGETDGDSYKAKRIRRNQDVTVASCTARDEGPERSVSAQATILPSDEVPRVELLLHCKYRLD